MNFIKNFKNIIILILILGGIIFSTTAIEMVSSLAKSIERYFTSTKPDYSNLSSKGYKVKSTPSSTKTSSSTQKSSASSESKSIFKSKPKPSAEDLDKQIMGKDNQNNLDPRAARFERSKKQLDNAVNEKKMSEEKFNMDFKELDKF